MRIYIKGGVWKNSEDEILKAAVMKYGLNNWSRVASLLVRKSAKQCKCRWYDWLDPQVKKTEWTRDEEQKLLHLAKLFPTQWRTIAPLVGRTAHQCLEHYDKLLDQVQGRLQLTDGSAGDKSEKDFLADPRRLRPGEIDPNPESKPSRADPVDMDDDEKEMLSEARARLANTRGKKAKRKAREKQLEEARRLASLQKKRELKAAGIGGGGGMFKKSRKYIDHAREIAFEQQPPKGHYDVPVEETPAGNLNFANISLQQLEGRRRAQEEERNRKDDTRKLKRLQEENLPKAMEMIEKLNDPQAFRKRSKLAMPTPQLSEDDLMLLTSPQDLAEAIADGCGESTGGRTPSSSIWSSGGGGSSLRPPSSLATPGSRTPTQALTPGLLRGAGGATPTSTLASGASTPYRDDVSVTEGSVDGDPVGSKAREHMLRMQIKSALANLPQPLNEIEAKLPDNEPQEPSSLTPDIDEDMEDVQRLKSEREEHRRREEFKRQSKVVQLGLPRPHLLPKLTVDGKLSYPNNVAERLVQEEMLALLANDSIRFPTSKCKPAHDAPVLMDFSDTELFEAKEMLLAETEMFEHLCNHGKDQEITEEEWRRVFDSFMYSPSQKKYVPVESMGTTDKLESYIRSFEIVKSQLGKEVKRTAKLSTKYKTHTEGYTNKLASMIKNIDDLSEEHKQLSADLTAFKTLQAQEAVSIKRRLAELRC
eukprot:GHVS01052293.1.p1 GENE.GHVS01052293.1~~GHVS01052293.1.p1  ORF type:complete len:705 (+),score=115.35 GHVS01052293.1:227-2341(+)